MKQQANKFTDNDLQHDFDYFKAQETAKKLLDYGLISSSEFNKLTLLNRKTFSPLYVEIMAKTS